MLGDMQTAREGAALVASGDLLSRCVWSDVWGRMTGVAACGRYGSSSLELFIDFLPLNFGLSQIVSITGILLFVRAEDRLLSGFPGALEESWDLRASVRVLEEAQA